jgi:hypothetical protein
MDTVATAPAEAASASRERASSSHRPGGHEGYGSFATVAGMFALLYLIGRALVYAAEVAAVRYARLWPRALDLTRPTEADTRALTLLAREQERIPAARVEFHLAEPGSPPE